MRLATRARWLLVALTCTLPSAALGCGNSDVASSSEDAKAWKAPAEGSCEAKAILAVANGATLDELDVEVGLDQRAARGIVEARPLESIAELDAVSYVGASALLAIQGYATTHGKLAKCAAGSDELGLISDLDQTVIPEAEPDLSLPPFPGVAALYQLLEHRHDGAAGDVHYVTAREPEQVGDVPGYLEEHGMPAGSIDTGVSGVPAIARKEKVEDHAAILDASGQQRFVLFGDTAHVDPEVQRDILAAYPERIVVCLIHKVNDTISAKRVAGLQLHESYAEAAAILYGAGVIERGEALEVMNAARDEGLEISKQEIQALLDAHAP